MKLSTLKLRTRYDQIVNVSSIGKCVPYNLNQIANLADNEVISHASTDKVRILVVAIDLQNDFMDYGALGVPGACGDIERSTHFIYNNLYSITKIIGTLDTHGILQIFHKKWWKDRNGNHPTYDPSNPTIITLESVLKGEWTTTYPQYLDKSMTYLEEIEKKGKVLIVWPYHCINGTTGHALENEFAKMVYFHSCVRGSQNGFISKGTNPFSEMYSAIKGLYDPENYINNDLLSEIEHFDRVIFIGQAKSHCVIETIMDILEFYKDRPDITQNMIILEDCMHSIPGFEDQTEKEFARLRNQYGIQFAKSTELQL